MSLCIGEGLRIRISAPGRRSGEAGGGASYASSRFAPAASHTPSTLCTR